jgi:hypothetical protein
MAPIPKMAMITRLNHHIDDTVDPTVGHSWAVLKSVINHRTRSLKDAKSMVVHHSEAASLLMGCALKYTTIGAKPIGKPTRNAPAAAGPAATATTTTATKP